MAIPQYLAGVRVENLEFHENLHWKLALVQHLAGIIKNIKLLKNWQDYSIVGTFSAPRWRYEKNMKTWY